MFGWVASTQGWLLGTGRSCTLVLVLKARLCTGDRVLGTHSMYVYTHLNPYHKVYLHTDNNMTTYVIHELCSV